MWAIIAIEVRPENLTPKKWWLELTFPCLGLGVWFFYSKCSERIWGWLVIFRIQLGRKIIGNLNAQTSYWFKKGVAKLEICRFGAWKKRLSNCTLELLQRYQKWRSLQNVFPFQKWLWCLCWFSGRVSAPTFGEDVSPWNRQPMQTFTFNIILLRIQLWAHVLESYWRLRLQIGMHDHFSDEM